jgi:Taurine catabolism dioxygenase TauD, TfdA family
MTLAAWHAADLRAATSWIFALDDRARRDLRQAVRKARDPDKSMFDYRRADFDLGHAGPVIQAALHEAMHGRGTALLRGLPRDDVDEGEFALLSWAIGLHIGVARPQGKASQYISPVRDIGTVYRSAGGRGYSSNADLDFHTDSADVVLLACYNQALSGGMSMLTSSVTAHQQLAAERPDLSEALHQPFWFSRQMEQAPDETAAYPNPVYDDADGLLCSKWNRNRIQIAQQIAGVPPLTPQQRAAMDALDEVLRRPELMYAMYLQPGDVQILNNHVTLHSRSEFVDYEEPSRKRVLFRLWLAPPDSPRLPESWLPAYRSVAPGTVRGGIIGQAYDATRREYELRQAKELGMGA